MTTAHPEPPTNFDAVPLLIRRFPPSGTWCRIHRVAKAPLYFGKSGASRFDAPAGEFGVLYVGRDAHCAFIETYGSRISGFHVKDAEFRPSGRVGVYGGYQPWNKRAGRFRS